MLRRFRVCGFVTFAMCVLEANADINDALTYWETLTVSSLHRRTAKRGTTSAQTVEFDSFGRHFALILHRNLSILAPGFQAFVFEAEGTRRQVRPEFDLYRGAVDGDSESFISAYFNADQALSASIRTSTETYSIEPAGNLVPDSPSDAMIIYRESDLKWDKSSRCGYLEEETNSTIVKETTSEEHYTHRNRSKRLTCKSLGKTCLLYIAADPRFVHGKGRHSIKETASYMLKIIDYADGVFRNTEFSECGKGFGFKVMKMNIFNSSTKGYKYTDLQRTFAYLKFLQVFGEDVENDDVCLGHVFTQQSFTHESYSVLGLAYLANPELSKLGGVCSRAKSKGMAFNKNVGWTTFLLGKTIVSDLQGTLVTTHELGHSWGASHDPETNEDCSPKSSNHGKYLMYPISVSGRDENNKYFSMCSRIAIKNVLQTKVDCFVTKKQAFCGNFLVEDDEQCDAGISFASSDDGNRCCDRNCKLKPKAVCSNANHACCSENCQIISNTSYPCFLPREDDCFETTFCDGTHRTCPALKPKPYGSPCSLHGQCQNGVCVPLCKLHNYNPCMCDDMSNGCKWCCIHENGTCAPLTIQGIFTLLPEGTICVGGVCDADGTCRDSVSGIMTRLWILLDLSSPADIVKFMRNNFVMLIIVLSLFLWFPASCYICYLDRRAKHQRLKILKEVVEEIVDGKIPGINAQMTVPGSDKETMLKESIRKLTVEVSDSLPIDSPALNSEEQTSAESQAASKYEREPEQEPEYEPEQETKDDPEQDHKREETPEQTDELRLSSKQSKLKHSLKDTDEQMPRHKHEHTPENKLKHKNERTHKHRDKSKETPEQTDKLKLSSKQSKLKHSLKDTDEQMPRHKHEHTPENKLKHKNEHTHKHRDKPEPERKHIRKHKSKQIHKDSERI